MNVVDLAPTRRNDLAEFLNDVEGLESIFATWDETQRGAVEAYRRAIEALHGEALTRLVRALKADPAALAAMKGAISDEIVYAVLRRHEIIRASLAERVELALASIRPMLASHGGDVELLKVVPPKIEVRFVGACDGCPASALTFHEGVKKAVEGACPEITEVVQVRGSGKGYDGSVNFVSPFAINSGDGWLDAGLITEIPDGGLRALVLGGEKLILSRRGTMVSCFQNACAHLGFALDDGEIEDGIITCPYHGFRYDLASGECLTAPEVQLQPHAVRVIGSRVEVRLAS
jgi:Fe-S cluster biogenesis protein NfuA/nitrite reductase/ring-hydroxylating ferredoxin subunit